MMCGRNRIYDPDVVICFSGENNLSLKSIFCLIFCVFLVFLIVFQFYYTMSYSLTKQSDQSVFTGESFISNSTLYLTFDLGRYVCNPLPCAFTYLPCRLRFRIPSFLPPELLVFLRHTGLVPLLFVAILYSNLSVRFQSNMP